MRRIIGIVLLLLVALVPPVSAAQRPVGLHVQGVSLVDGTGARFVISGVNEELYRDKGCDWISTYAYQKRDAIASRMSELGINMVRLNYSSSWIMETGNVAKFVDVIQGLKARGIYSMWAAHDFTGKSINNIETAFPAIGALIDEVRKRGDADLEKYVIAGMVNEPGPDVTASQWILAAKKSLDYLRTQKQFSGVVTFDGVGWATALDIPSFKAVMAYDAGKLGGTPNVMFANHYYENIGTGVPFASFAAANQVPLFIGELGIFNGGPTVPKYATDVIAKFFTPKTGMDIGHNGILMWQWAWCDDDSLTINWDDAHVKDQLVLTSYGNQTKLNLWDKLKGNLPPPPQSTIIVQLPTATVQQTKTVLPTNTRQPTRTPSPVPSAVPTAQCDATMQTSGQFNGKQAVFTTCIRYQ